MNSVNLLGRLTRDVELRYTPSEKAVASFSIAVGRGDQTDFINCVAWEKTAQFINQYFHKGDMIAVSGRLQSRTYETQNGKRTVLEVVVNKAYFAGGKRVEGPAHFEEIGEDEDLPF